MIRVGNTGSSTFRNVLRTTRSSHQRRTLATYTSYTEPQKWSKGGRSGYGAFLVLVSTGIALGASCMQEGMSSCSSSSSPVNSDDKSIATSPHGEVLRLRPACEEEDSSFQRIDNIAGKEFAKLVPKNLVHDTLNGAGKIEAYEIYKKKDAEEVWAIIRFGDLLNGHPNYVHGGMISTMIDMTFGWLFFACNYPAAMTANLNIDFRKPVQANSTVLLKASIKEVKGRKLYMTATMEDVNGDIVAESSSLFIILRKRVRYPMAVKNYMGL